MTFWSAACISHRKSLRTLLMVAATETLDGWDPLDTSVGADPGMVISAQRREISNILRSYTGYYDLFAELLQNALDAVEKRAEDASDSYLPKVWVYIDLHQQTVQVTDNGCGMSMQQLRQFLRPNFSFKAGTVTRGNTGVGATYLGYGFNSLHVSTKVEGVTVSGRIENGRRWVDDRTGTVPRPVIKARPPHAEAFSEVDQGTAITIQLTGDNIRPGNLGWYQAATAEQWLPLLRIMTPLGGIYLDGSSPPVTDIYVRVTSQTGNISEATISAPEYLFPNTSFKGAGQLLSSLRTSGEKLHLALICPRFRPNLRA
jgi:hypothetical protein